MPHNQRRTAFLTKLAWGLLQSAITDTLDDIEGFLIDDGLMRILENLPVCRIVPHLFPAFEGFFLGLEVHRVAKILLLYQDVGHSPLLPESGLFRPLCRSPDAQRPVMLRWRRNAPTHQLIGYLRGAFPGYAHFEDVANNGNGLLVYDPMVFILRVLQISVGRIRAERFPGVSFCPEYHFHLLAGVFGVEFVENVDERGHIIVNLILVVHTIVDGDEADIVGQEHHFLVHADLKVVPSEAARFLEDDDTNLAIVDQAGKPLSIRP